MGEPFPRDGTMQYQYNPEKFWGSIDKIKDIKNSLDKLPQPTRFNVMHLLYKAMEATKDACIATIDEDYARETCYARDKETDRGFLSEIIVSFIPGEKKAE